MLRKEMNLFENVMNTMGEKASWMLDRYFENMDEIKENNLTIEDCIIDRFDNIKIIHDTEDMYNAGLQVACCTKNPETNEEIILVDAAFINLLSENAKRVVIAHEVGHIYNKHLENISGILSDINKEIEADFYAVDLYGKEATIAGLVELIEVVAKILPRYVEEDMKNVCDIMEARIEAIKNK